MPLSIRAVVGAADSTARYRSLDSGACAVREAFFPRLKTADPDCSGEGGYVPSSKSFLEGLQKICNREGIMFIIDEVGAA